VRINKYELWGRRFNLIGKTLLCTRDYINMYKEQECYFFNEDGYLLTADRNRTGLNGNGAEWLVLEDDEQGVEDLI
jgi:hypothetical protein